MASLIGVVLLWAGGFKLLHRNASATARRSVLATLVGKDRAVTGYRAVGAVEIVVGLLVLLSPAAAYASAVLFAGMLGYLAYGRWRTPDASCGCLGDKHAPVRGRSFARAGLLLAASIAATTGWPDGPLATVGVVVVGLAVVVVLSPELDHRWLFPLRRWRTRIRHPLGRLPVTIPLESTVQQLSKSGAYRSVVEQLTSDLHDHWDEGEWRMLTYAARTPSGPATAVFAVPRLAYEPDRVRVALVPEEKEAIFR